MQWLMIRKNCNNLILNWGKWQKMAGKKYAERGDMSCSFPLPVLSKCLMFDATSICEIYNWALSMNIAFSHYFHETISDV